MKATSTRSTRYGDDCISLINAALQRCLDPACPYVLWDFPNHSNVGDSAIWKGEIKALNMFFRKQPRHTCELVPDWERLPDLSPNTQIILHGGGNLGDLWERHQLFRERIVREYPNHKIVQMPQSIHFRDKIKLKQCREVFSRHPNLCIMARDQASYKIARSIHDGQTELVPDMALALGTIRRPCQPTVPIVGLLRKDQEKHVADDTEILCTLKAADWITEPPYRETRILYHLKRAERRLPNGHTVLGSLRTKLFNRLADIRTHRGCKMLSNGHVVITDRLHAHILSSLMQIPHVFLDNNYGKLSAFRRAWNIGGDDLCHEASSLAEAFEIAQGILQW